VKTRLQSLRKHSGFSLLELLASTAVVGGVMIVIASAIATMQNAYVRTRSKIDTFRSAQAAMETVSRRLGMATLNSRLEVFKDKTTNNEEAYRRQSDLHFYSGPVSNIPGNNGDQVGHAVFFQAPLGVDDVLARDQTIYRHDRLHHALNAWGYFIELTTDDAQRPSFMSEADLGRRPKLRFRLMEFRQPTDEFALFRTATGDSTERPAISADTANTLDAVLGHTRQAFVPDTRGQRAVSVVAENIVAMFLRPISGGTGPGSQDAQRYAIAPNLEYDTRAFQYSSTSTSELIRHRLPPAVELTFVAVAEETWQKIGEDDAGRARGQALMQQIRAQVSSGFRDATSFDSQLQQLQRFLDNNKIDHRILVQTIPLPEGRKNFQ
jgi:uncharacterized protein (TIGR02599 family)